MESRAKLDEVVRSLTNEELTVLKYFIKYRSVGELLAIRELKALYGVQEPVRVINRLIDKGLLTRGLGCYNVSQDVLKYIKIT